MTQSDAMEITLRAERQLGRLCKEVTGGKAGSVRTAGKARQGTAGDTVLLADLDITKAQSSRWQKLAGITDGVVGRTIRRWRAEKNRVMTPKVSAPRDRITYQVSNYTKPETAARKLREKFGAEWFDAMVDAALALRGGRRG